MVADNTSVGRMAEIHIYFKLKKKNWRILKLYYQPYYSKIKFNSAEFCLKYKCILDLIIENYCQNFIFNIKLT